MKVLAISGSLRRDSHNTALLRAAAELLPPSVELEIFDGLKAVEPYDEDDDMGRGPGRGPPVARRDRVGRRRPDRHPRVQLLDSPVSSRTPSTGPRGHSRENALWGKPVAVVGASTGMFGAVWSQAEARKALGASGARVIETDLPVGHADEAFTDDGRLVDLELRERYVEILDELVSLAEQADDAEKLAA